VALHLQVIASVPLAFKTHIHSAFRSKVRFLVLGYRRRDEGTPAEITSSVRPSIDVEEREI
jgi:hypothetical protein